MISEVTVLVLSYNSEKTIIETLESVRNQSFANIHLMVSDDCSLDSTYDVVNDWINNNGSRFLSCVIKRTPYNYGVSKHMDICVRSIKTDWFKGLAADDILLPDAIEKYVKYVNTHVCHGMVYAKHLNFSQGYSGRQYGIDFEEQLYQKRFNRLSARDQRTQIAKREVLCSPTCFTNRNDVISSGGYDLRIKNIEDWPIKMRLLDCGFKMNRMNEYTILYRVGDSISHSNDLYFKPEHVKWERVVKKIYCYPILENCLVYKWNELVTNLRYYLIIYALGNKKNFMTKAVNYFLCCLNTEKIKKAVINTRMKNVSKKEVARLLHRYSLKEE